MKIRLRRMGSRGKPFYRVVVSDSRKVPTARIVENLGYYDPRPEPPVVQIDLERADHWVSQGALATPTVHTLLKRLRTGA